MDSLKAHIRDVPDFPKPGIVFKDITPALLKPFLFKQIIEHLVQRWEGQAVSKVLGIESRGFIFGAPLAERLGAGFVPVRKAGKLPYQTMREAYALEYGEAVLELHTDAIHRGERVIIVDDLLATGGTAQATRRLAQRQGAELLGFSFIIELGFLNGRKTLAPDSVHSLVSY